MSFQNLGLSAELIRAIADQGYREPTPVQTQSIPLILQGRDLLARAQTGTGKTAGFTLPLLQRLAADSNQPPARGRRRVRALILTPTRELAAQVADSVKAYGRHLPLKSTVLFGGVNIRPQIATLAQGVDIVIATPGRLLDHAQQRTIDLSHVDILVLDEADRMLDMGFIHDIKRVLNLLPKDKQSLLFSATFSADIKRLAASLLRSPAEVAVAPQKATADRVEHRVHPVDRERKRELLSHLIAAGDWRQVLVFTRTKHGANRLAKQLEQDGLSAAAIHGNKSQSARTKALASFKSGGVRVLVATDIAARGLDIEQLPHVVNYELPNVAEDYVHRIGRTARAGLTGEAVSLVCVDEAELLKGIETLLKQRLEQVVVPGFEPDPRARPQPLPGVGGQRRHGSPRASGGREHQGAAGNRRPGKRPGAPGAKRPASGRGRSAANASDRGRHAPR
jgi:ATP-dependent RNA helicase RhlE